MLALPARNALRASVRFSLRSRHTHFPSAPLIRLGHVHVRHYHRRPQQHDFASRRIQQPSPPTRRLSTRTSVQLAQFQVYNLVIRPVDDLGEEESLVDLRVVRSKDELRDLATMGKVLVSRRVLEARGDDGLKMLDGRVEEMEDSVVAVGEAGSSSSALAVQEHAVKLEQLGGRVRDELASRFRSTTAKKYQSYSDAELSSAARELLQATRTGDSDRALALLEDEVEVNVHAPGSGLTPLHFAAWFADVDVVRKLLQVGAEVNRRSQNGATALHMAASSGCTATVQHLLDAGADSKLTTSTWTSTVFGQHSGQLALHVAASKGHTDIVNLLVAHDPLTAAYVDESDRTALQLAETELHAPTADTLRELASEEYVLLEVAEPLFSASAVR